MEKTTTATKSGIFAKLIKVAKSDAVRTLAPVVLSLVIKAKKK